MATYQDQLIGISGEYDLYAEPLVGGVTYAVGAFGASNGGTLPDPAVFIYDSTGTLVDYQFDNSLLGQDVLIQYTPPSTGTYYVLVADEIGGTGSYTLSIEPAGPPIFFGSTPGSTFL